MKTMNTILILTMVMIFSGCGKDNKAGNGGGSASNGLSYPALTDPNTGCTTPAQSFSGATPEESKRNYCQGLMNDQLNNFCASYQRQQLFNEQNCAQLNMAYDSNHFYNYNSAPFSNQFRVQYTNGNPNAWFYVNVNGNTWDEYQNNLRMHLLDERIRFEMGAYKRRQMFYQYFPGQYYYIY